MRPKVVLIAAAAFLTAGIAAQLGAQAPAPAPPGGQGAAGGRGGGRATFPAQQRAAGDPALIARGKTLYEINCRSCHGADLRGGDIGGPNLLRSDVVLKDSIGELIEPIVRNGKSTPGVTLVMPPMPLTSADVRAVAEYIHDVVSTARGQGAPPPGPPVVLNILVGNATAGQAYFAARCSSCHSATGDMRGIATRIPDPKQLQNAWVNGGGGGRGGRGAGGAAPEVTVTVTPASGPAVTGRLTSIDDFLVVLTTAEGERRSFARRGNTPRVEINDPLSAHTDLLEVYTDKDIHDVTAYLVTLK